MSQENVPTEVAADEQAQRIPLLAEVIRQSHGVEVERTGDGLVLSVLVLAAGGITKETFLVGPEGKKAIRDAVTGGLELP